MANKIQKVFPAKIIKPLFISLIITTILLALFATYAIKPLPELKQVKSSALPINEENKLVQMLQKEYPKDPNLTGVLELSDPLDAFVARSVLLNLAQASIDLQYYIWPPIPREPCCSTTSIMQLKGVFVYGCYSMIIILGVLMTLSQF